MTDLQPTLNTPDSMPDIPTNAFAPSNLPVLPTDTLPQSTQPMQETDAQTQSASSEEAVRSHSESAHKTIELSGRFGFKKHTTQIVVAVAALFVLVTGVAASMIILGKNADNRQQASGGPYAAKCYVQGRAVEQGDCDVVDTSSVCVGTTMQNLQKQRDVMGDQNFGGKNCTRTTIAVLSCDASTKPACLGSRARNCINGKVVDTDCGTSQNCDLNSTTAYCKDQEKAPETVTLSCNSSTKPICMGAIARSCIGGKVVDTNCGTPQNCDITSTRAYCKDQGRPDASTPPVANSTSCSNGQAVNTRQCNATGLGYLECKEEGGRNVLKPQECFSGLRCQESGGDVACVSIPASSNSDVATQSCGTYNFPDNKSGSVRCTTIQGGAANRYMCPVGTRPNTANTACLSESQVRAESACSTTVRADFASHTVSGFTENARICYPNINSETTAWVCASGHVKKGESCLASNADSTGTNSDLQALSVGSGGSVQTSGAVALGGGVGSACTNEGAIVCNPGTTNTAIKDRAVLLCSGGMWIDQYCGIGLVCDSSQNQCVDQSSNSSQTIAAVGGNSVITQSCSSSNFPDNKSGSIRCTEQGITRDRYMCPTGTRLNTANTACLSESQVRAESACSNYRSDFASHLINGYTENALGCYPDINQEIRAFVCQAGTVKGFKSVENGGVDGQGCVTPTAIQTISSTVSSSVANVATGIYNTTVGIVSNIVNGILDIF